MWAIYQISYGQDMPDSVTKNDLIQIIDLLLKKLDWIENEEASRKPTSPLDADTDVRMKISLKFNAMSILMAELQQTQMWAIYQISLGQDMPDSVTKNDLIKIIELLLKQLDWIEKDEASRKPTSPYLL